MTTLLCVLGRVERVTTMHYFAAQCTTLSFSIIFERLQAAKSVLWVSGCKVSARRAKNKMKIKKFSFFLPSRLTWRSRVVQTKCI